MNFVLNYRHMRKNLWIILVVALIVVVVFTIRNMNEKKTALSRVDLDRPLVVGVVSWPGYAGGILANGGFEVNPESIYTKKYGLPVRFVLIEDIDARGKAFAKGGPDGVDVVWSTVDFWANELPNFITGGIEGRAFLHVDWSRGGDAIVANERIRTVEQLKNKKIALVQFTPSHWLLENALRWSDLSESDIEAIRSNLIFTQDVPTARSTFVAGHADAAVVWEPDVKQALKKSGAHILVSSRDYPELIADVMVAQERFIKEHPKAIEAFVRGWLDGVRDAKKNPELAARVLVENEPLFEDLGLDETKKSLSWVYWPDLQDNVRMFGLDGRSAFFDTLFEDAGAVWKSLGAIQATVAPERARDDSILRRLFWRK